MRKVAVMFFTTGASPKDGHRVTELLAAELLQGKASGKTLRQSYAPDGESGGRSLAQQFDELDAFIGDAKVVVYHAPTWRKFMRVELQNVKKASARRLVREVDDVVTWAYQRFPKQRKDLASLGKKVGVKLDASVEGIERDAALLIGVVVAMAAGAMPAIEARPDSVAADESLKEIREAPEIARRSLGERLHLCWRVLSGQA